MAALRRFTQSPRYRALWRIHTDWPAAVGSVLTFVLTVIILREVLSEKAWSFWGGPLALAAGLTARFVIQGISDLIESKNDPVDTTHSRSVEDRLDELERLKRRDMVTPEEYAVKRQEILKEL